MVSAFATQAGLVLGQEKVHDTSNEITAIPIPLESRISRVCWSALMPWVASATLRHKFTNRGGDYLLAVKGNQPRCKRRLRPSPYTHRATTAHERNASPQRTQQRHVAQATTSWPRFAISFRPRKPPSCAISLTTAFSDGVSSADVLYSRYTPHAIRPLQTAGPPASLA